MEYSIETNSKMFGYCFANLRCNFFAVASIIQEQTKPMKVTTGVMINGEFKATNSGHMGGNAKAQEDMGWLKGIAIMFGITGSGMSIGATFVKEEEKPKY